jgi:hypothetical protein
LYILEFPDDTNKSSNSSHLPSTLPLFHIYYKAGVPAIL